MTNCSLITNQTFDVKKTKQKYILNREDINDFDSFYNNIGRGKAFQERKKPLLSQNEIEDFFVEHEDSSASSVSQGSERCDKMKVDGSGNSYLASKHISIKTLLIILFSFIAGAVVASLVTVGYYNLKSSVMVADERFPLFEESLVQNKVLIEDVKSRIDELSIRIEAMTNHLIESGKNGENQINSNDNVDKH